MDCTRNAAEACGLSSTLILTSSTAPLVSSTTLSRIGPNVVHGPHHGAHKSTTTGTWSERASTSVSKVASVTSIDMERQATSTDGVPGTSTGAATGDGHDQPEARVERRWPLHRPPLKVSTGRASPRGWKPTST